MSGLGDFVRDRVFPLTGGNKIRHFTVEVTDEVLDFFSTVFGGDSKQEIKNLECIYRLRIIVTNGYGARLNINDCVDTLDADHGIIVDFEHPFNESFPITSLSAICTTQNKKCNMEVTIWY